MPVDLTFGYGSTPNKSPEDATEEVAEEKRTVDDDHVEDEAVDVEALTGQEQMQKSKTAQSEQAEAQSQEVGATKKWTSNVKSWFGAWKDGTEVDARELDGLASSNNSGVIIQGQLWKQGQRAGDAFHTRWVSVDKENVSYSVENGAPVIDRIAFADIIAVCYHKVGVRGKGEDGTDAENIVTTMATEGQKPEDAAHQTALAQVEAVEDHTKEYAESASLMVNIIFRDEMMHEAIHRELAHVKDLTLKATDFALITAKESYQRGRIFVLRAESREAAEAWSETLARILARFQNVPIVRVGLFAWLRRSVRWFYVGDRCQICVAALILSNFVTNIFEAQFTPPPGSATEAIFSSVDTVFTIIFTVELCVNMFATLFWEFLIDAWNWFDLTVVLVSLMSLFLTDLPGANVLRLMRCFRVFRLFKRIPSLRQIVVALTASVPPMINAFALVCLVTAIYAIVGVTFFSQQSPENFVDFFTAMFTMFQVMTGDNWSDIARDLFVQTGQGAAVAMYFVSFQLIVALVLVNVVIAVLLDEFSKAADRRSSADSHGGDSEDSHKSPFEKIAKYLADYKDLDDLESMINDLFDRVLVRSRVKKTFWGGASADTRAAKMRLLRQTFKRWHTGEPCEPEGDGQVGFAEFRAGVKSLGFIPPIIVTKHAWDEYVLSQAEALHVNEDELLGRRGFMGLMKQALKAHQLRNLNAAMDTEQDSWDKQGIAAVLLGVKGLLVEDLEMAKGGLTVLSDKARDELAEEAHESANEAERAATELLLKRLVTDMHKMHTRFDTVEAELASLSDKRNRVAKPAAPLVPQGPGEAIEGGEAADPVEVQPREGGARKASSKSFVGKVASQRRAATRAAAPNGSHTTDPAASDLAATPGGGQLTARGATGATQGAPGWAFGSLAAFTDPSKTPLAPPNPAALFSQSNEAANNLMGGFMGGLSSLGDSVTKAVPAMPEGLQMKMPQLPAMPEVPAMTLQVPSVPGFTPFDGKEKDK